MAPAYLAPWRGHKAAPLAPELASSFAAVLGRADVELGSPGPWTRARLTRPRIVADYATTDGRRMSVVVARY